MKQEKTNGEIIERFIKFTFYQVCDYILNLEELVSDLKEEVSDLEQYNTELIGDNNSLLSESEMFKFDIGKVVALDNNVGKILDRYGHNSVLFYQIKFDNEPIKRVYREEELIHALLERR